MYTKKAKSISFDSTKKRDKADVSYIVIHYTGGTKDSAKNNVDYFAKGNTTAAGAHFFVDQSGKVGKSIPMERAAWAVGGNKLNTAGGSLYGEVTNYNSISIELCAIAETDPTDAMVKSVAELIAYIRKYCPNAIQIVRHYDVTGKECPKPMIKAEAWDMFLMRVGKEYLFLK